MKNRLCKTTLVQKDSGIASIVQVEFLSQTKNAVNATPYGVHSSPVLNTPCLLITINNDPANCYALPLSFLARKEATDREELKESEVLIGNFTKKASILFDENGNINIATQENLNASVEKDVEINANGNLDATITGTADVVSAGNMTVNAPNVNITGDTLVTGTLGNTGVMSAGNGTTGTFATSVTVLNGIVTGGS